MYPDQGHLRRIAFWDGSKNLSSNASLNWDNSNNRLGLGIAAPSSNLHVYNGAGGGGGAYCPIIDAIIEDDDYAFLELNGSSMQVLLFNDDNLCLRAGMMYQLFRRCLVLQNRWYRLPYGHQRIWKCGYWSYRPVTKIAYRRKYEAYRSLL